MGRYEEDAKRVLGQIDEAFADLGRKAQDDDHRQRSEAERNAMLWKLLLVEVDTCRKDYRSRFDVKFRNDAKRFVQLSVDRGFVELGIAKGALTVKDGQEDTPGRCVPLGVLEGLELQRAIEDEVSKAVEAFMLRYAMPRR